MDICAFIEELRADEARVEQVIKLASTFWDSGVFTVTLRQPPLLKATLLLQLANWCWHATLRDALRLWWQQSSLVAVVRSPIVHSPSPRDYGDRGTDRLKTVSCAADRESVFELSAGSEFAPDNEAELARVAIRECDKLRAELVGARAEFHEASSQQLSPLRNRDGHVDSGATDLCDVELCDCNVAGFGTTEDWDRLLGELLAAQAEASESAIAEANAAMEMSELRGLSVRAEELQAELFTARAELSQGGADRLSGSAAEFEEADQAMSEAFTEQAAFLQRSSGEGEAFVAPTLPEAEKSSSEAAVPVMVEGREPHISEQAATGETESAAAAACSENTDRSTVCLGAASKTEAAAATAGGDVEEQPGKLKRHVGESDANACGAIITAVPEGEKCSRHVGESVAQQRCEGGEETSVSESDSGSPLTPVEEGGSQSTPEPRSAEVGIGPDSPKDKFVCHAARPKCCGLQ